MSEAAIGGREGEMGAGRQRVWPWALAVVGMVMYLVWAGSARDPRATGMWAFTQPDARGADHGWLLPAPGIPHFLFACFLLCGALGRLAFAAGRCSGMKRWWGIFSAGVIFLGGIAVRACVLKWWVTLVLSPGGLLAKTLPAAEPWRWVGVVADGVTILLLLSAQLRKRREEGRNLWMAAVYAFHPAVLIGVVDGSRWLWIMPAVVLVAGFAPRLRRWVQWTLMMAGAGACGVLLWRITAEQAGHPFNGMVAAMLGQMGADAGRVKWILAGGGILLEGVVLVLAMSKRWSVARAWGHMIAVWALFSPSVMPTDLLPAIALLPLAWVNASGWFSAAVLCGYGMVLSYSPGAAWELPMWLMYVAMVPGVVMEVEELGRQGAGALVGFIGGMMPRGKTSPVQALEVLPDGKPQ